MLKEKVLNSLLHHFNDVTVDRKSKYFAIFPAKHPEVGEVRIEEDGSELILYIGEITHGHFGSYEPGLSEQEHSEIIVESVTDFLRDLFADEYYLFRGDQSGGWARLDMVKESDMRSRNMRWYKWSGPITIDN